MNKSKATSIVFHITAWLFFMVIPLFLSQADRQENTNTLFSWQYILLPFFYMVIFYLNVYLLFPKLYLTRRYFLYGLAIALLLLLVLSIQPFNYIQPDRQTEDPGRPAGLRLERERSPLPQPGHLPPPRHGGPAFDILGLFVFLMVIGTGTAFRAIQEWQLTENRAILAESERASAEADRAMAELSFLKAQINPHFLYNTLNNIYTLCLTNSDKAAESVMKLSNIMRYITDEAEENFVPLAEEIDCVTDFIDLQKLRLGKKVRLNYVVSGEASGKQISPLIFMTFIENAFKYGLSNHNEAPIDVYINMKDREISLHTSNRVFENKQHSTRTGLGIKNTKKRLEHLYSGHHELSIQSKDGLFTVDLHLQV